MKIIRLRYLVEVGVVAVLMVVMATSYWAREESVVGRELDTMVEMALSKNNYAVAQKLYEQAKVHGAVVGDESIELRIYPQKRLAAEIARVEELLTRYPTYPPLLKLLVQLNRLAGNESVAKEYEDELVRLGVVR